MARVHTNSTRRIAVVALAVAVVAAAALALQFPAPATFNATIGATAVAGGVGSVGAGAAGGAKATTLGAGSTMTVALMSYSTKEELKTLSGITDPQAFIKALSEFSHGTVTLGKRSIDVNATSSKQVGSKYSISLLTAKPLEASRGAASASGTSCGLIHLTVDATGKGIGTMYTATHVALSVDGVFTAHAGMATATELTNVTKQ